MILSQVQPQLLSQFVLNAPLQGHLNMIFFRPQKRPGVAQGASLHTPFIAMVAQSAFVLKGPNGSSDGDFPSTNKHRKGQGEGDVTRGFSEHFNLNS